ARARDTKKQVLEGIIQRKLLAREAKAFGFDVSAEDMWRRVLEDGTVYVTVDRWAGEIPVPIKTHDGVSDKEAAKRLISCYLRRNIGEFAESQIDEALARAMRQLVLSSVAVSPREVWDDFVRERDKVTLKYVRFRPEYYKDTLDITSGELSEW